MTHDSYYDDFEAFDPASLLPKTYNMELSTSVPNTEPLEDLLYYNKENE